MYIVSNPYSQKQKPCHGAVVGAHLLGWECFLLIVSPNIKQPCGGQEFGCSLGVEREFSKNLEGELPHGVCDLP